MASQPLNQPNAGSVFRNPPGDHAARLIDQCGLKGLAIGGAQVSPKHANFIVNRGGASAADIEALIERVRAAVKAKTGVELIPEVRIVGAREAPWLRRARWAGVAVLMGGPSAERDLADLRKGGARGAARRGWTRTPSTRRSASSST